MLYPPLSLLACHHLTNLLHLRDFVALLDSTEQRLRATACVRSNVQRRQSQVRIPSKTPALIILCDYLLDWELSQKVNAAGVQDNLFTVVYSELAIASDAA